MLKKIVKLGHSNALVLDKAIMELLNMSEGSLVKLTTDGKSLTITPQQPDVPGQEKLTQSYDEYIFSKYSTPIAKQTANQSYETIIKNRNTLRAFQDKYKEVEERMVQVTTSDEYKKELDILTKEHEQSGDHTAFEAKCLELLCKFIPEYQAYYEELKQLFPIGK
ncbi:TPA: hypothetical protein DDZ86_04205 [Candidatus Dependentiae bacterium]|nr:MAG: hypothetical protein UW09_C0003G0188 [candidate division TM6 bacterium GW2011_GWF2_43_87]HBL98817.1 hypothetical protein [Candidatus Dependentiae bacterium]